MIHLDVQIHQFMPWRVHFPEELIMVRQSLLQVPDRLVLCQALVGNFRLQVPCDKKPSFPVNFCQSLHGLTGCISFPQIIVLIGYLRRYSLEVQSRKKPEDPIKGVRIGNVLDRRSSLLIA